MFFEWLLACIKGRCDLFLSVRRWLAAMLTLSVRYTINPNKLADFKAYVIAELGPIGRSGGKTLGHFLPADFAGPTTEALGLIDFATFADYEQYRMALGNDPEHRKNVARLQQSGAIVAMSKSIIEHVAQG